MLDLHPNTVRPHLERMREVGLLEVDAPTTAARSAVRRTAIASLPTRRRSASSRRPCACWPACWPPRRRSAASTPKQAADAGASKANDAGEARRNAAPHRRRPLRAPPSPTSSRALGFDPAAVDDGATATIAFTRCPFQELAEAYPDLVCHLHRGMIEGFVTFQKGCGSPHSIPLPTATRAGSSWHRAVAVPLVVRYSRRNPNMSVTETTPRRRHHPHRRRCGQGGRTARSRRATSASRCASLFARAVVPASPTRCSSTPRPTTRTSRTDFGGVRVVVDTTSAQLLVGRHP